MNSIQTDFAFALAGITLFIFRNPHQKFLYGISLFTLGLFASQFVYLFKPGTGQAIWIISAIGLTILYFLRFKDKQNVFWIDYLKIPAVILLLIYPIPFNSLVYLPKVMWIVLQPFTFWLPAFIYVYDRWILKPETMKKKFIIMLVAQSAAILLMAMYAYAQHAEAETQRRNADVIKRENEDLIYRLQQQMKDSDTKGQ